MQDKCGKNISFFEQSRKICFRQKSLSNGMAWAHYQNDHERLFYENNKQHTLSMYIAGGFETHRTDIRSDFGAPGRFCLMPKGSESHWQLGQQQQFMHLYFDDNYLKKLALKTFDIDPRSLALPELTFFENAGLESLFRHQIVHANWRDTNSQMILEQVSTTILVTMLQNLGGSKFRDKVTGGLAPKVILQVCDFIQSHFHRQVFLSELAAIAQLSEYHFCRMFKENMAQTPQEYITRVRIEQVKQRCVTTKMTLADIALQCGFSSQSHMGRYFKKIMGISPKQFRQHHLSGGR